LLHPSDGSAYLRLAAAMERSGRNREAVAALTRAAELSPYEPDIPRLLAEAQAALSAADEATELDRKGDGPR